MKLTSLYHKIERAAADPRYRIIANEGGTSSSKTWSEMQLAYAIADRSRRPVLISVVSETLPHLKKGAMRDFFRFLDENGLYKRENHNKTDHVYKVNKSQIEFFSADQESKAKGPRRDFLFIIEANHISLKIFNQLEIRTRLKIFADWNPDAEFWFHSEVQNRPDCLLIKSTFEDNEYLPEENRRAIEARRPVYDDDGNLISGNEEWWKVYGLGLMGQSKGLIYPNWQFCDEMPTDYKWRLFGMDFGYTNDPTAVVEVRLSRGELWFDEYLYKTGLTNPDLAQELKTKGIGRNDLIVADCADPKSIEELCRLGFRVVPCQKGRDSIRNGIQTVKRFKINVTKRSTNCAKEFRNYKYAEDRDGNLLNEPIDDYNHLMDGGRYAVSHKVNAKRGVLYRG